MKEAVFFSNIPLIDPSVLGHDDEVWGVVCEFKAWAMVYLLHCCVICNLYYWSVLYCHLAVWTVSLLPLQPILHIVSQQTNVKFHNFLFLFLPFIVTNNDKGIFYITSFLDHWQPLCISLGEFVRSLFDSSCHCPSQIHCQHFHHIRNEEKYTPISKI